MHVRCMPSKINSAEKLKNILFKYTRVLLYTYISTDTLLIAKCNINGVIQWNEYCSLCWCLFQPIFRETELYPIELPLLSSTAAKLDMLC